MNLNIGYSWKSIIFTTDVDDVAADGCIASGTDLSLSDIQAAARTATIEVCYGYGMKCPPVSITMSTYCP